MERWIRFKGVVINLALTTNIEVSDNSWDIRFYFPGGLSKYIQYNYETDGDGGKIISDILAGKYDVTSIYSHTEATPSLLELAYRLKELEENIENAVEHIERETEHRVEHIEREFAKINDFVDDFIESHRL